MRISVNADLVLINFLSLYLVIDSINGWMVLSLGMDIKISALYKGILLLLVAWRLLRRNLVKFEYCLIGVLLLMAGETIFVCSGKSSGSHVTFVFMHALKLISPVLLYFYFEGVLAAGAGYRRAIDRILIVSSVVFAANILFGLLGFGFSTYDGAISDTSVGIKGFFYAGNEVTSVFLVLTAFVQGRYAGRGWKMWLAIAGCLAIGLTIATKTALLGGLILCFGIPLLLTDRSKRRFFVVKFCALAAAPAVLVYALMSDFAISIFKDLLDRVVFIYHNQGLIGVLLSSRDAYLADMWRASFSNASNVETVVAAVFGHGVSYYAEVVKYSSEMDFADVFFWNGVLGVAVLFSGIGLSSYHAVRGYFSTGNFNGKVVLFLNALLFVSSNIGGHIFTSGMFSIVWAAMCATCILAQDETVRDYRKPSSAMAIAV